VWHELVLNGVGGRTIAEAKENMSFSEAVDWFAYLHSRGSVHLGRRVEAAAALIVTTYLRAKGAKNVEMSTFMPHEREAPASIEDILQLLTPAAGAR
jgi:hypothetical protein